MLYEIDDPVAHTDTRWDSSSKTVKVIHLPQRAFQRDTSKAPQCSAACFDETMSAPGAVVEKLGVKTNGGVVAEGTRSGYTVPAGKDNHGQPIVVVHESWYSPQLKIVILEIDDDPRSGTFRDELVDIVRGEPDVTKYLAPTDYVVHDVQIP